MGREATGFANARRGRFLDDLAKLLENPGANDVSCALTRMGIADCPAGCLSRSGAMFVLALSDPEHHGKRR